MYVCICMRSVVAQGQNRLTVNAMLWVRFPLEEIQYFIFLFLRSGGETKRDVEFRYTTRSVSRIQRKEGSGVSTYGIQREAEKNKNLYFSFFLVNLSI